MAAKAKVQPREFLSQAEIDSWTDNDDSEEEEEEEVPESFSLDVVIDIVFRIGTRADEIK